MELKINRYKCGALCQVTTTNVCELCSWRCVPDTAVCNTVSVTSGVCNNPPLLDCHVIMRRRHVILGHYWWFVTLWSRWFNARAIKCISYPLYIYQWTRFSHSAQRKECLDFYFKYECRPYAYRRLVYGVYVSKLIRYSRACGSYHDFRDRMLLLTKKLLNQGFHIIKLKSPLWNVHGHQGYVSFVVIKIMSFFRSWLAIEFVPTVVRQMSLVEQELLKLPEHRIAPQVLVGFVSVFRFVCRVLIYGFWLPLCYLQTVLTQSVSIPMS